MAQTFTIRVNGGEALKTFSAATFEEFKSNLGTEWTCGSEQGLESFFRDRYQVKALISDNRLVCR